MKIEGFEDLEIWKEARELAKFVFDLTSREPFINDFRFRNQIRAAAGSTMDNISEGYGWGGNKEFANLLSIAKVSNEEVRSQAYRAFDFKYISDAELKELLGKTDKLSRKIKNLMIYLRKTPLKGTKFK